MVETGEGQRGGLPSPTSPLDQMALRATSLLHGGVTGGVGLGILAAGRARGAEGGGGAEAGGEHTTGDEVIYGHRRDQIKFRGVQEE
uniref:Uncharacterized protein n=1 Tax=Oryza sativa subsp. japonica TaxID=39947 RepID=Q6Z5D5_ORYSJ|nr:hypothetical protein [Oryza sativa Japonica Group]